MNKKMLLHKAKKAKKPKEEDVEANVCLMADSENEEVILFDQTQIYRVRK